MTKESKSLVNTFKEVVEVVRSEKDEMRKTNLNVFRQTNTVPKLSKEEMNSMDKKRVLELFVEHDNALSLLLDFISTKHLNKPGFNLNQTQGETSFGNFPQVSQLNTMQSNGIQSPSIFNVQPSG